MSFKDLNENLEESVYTSWSSMQQGSYYHPRVIYTYRKKCLHNGERHTHAHTPSHFLHYI